MKQLDGRADAVVSASLATAFSAVADAERYPGWGGEYIREATVLERDADGRAVRAHVVVHVAQSPFGNPFELDVAISSDPPRAVEVGRLPTAPSDPDRLSLRWSLRSERHGTRIGLEFSAAVSFLPAVLPLPGVGGLIARTLVDAVARELGGYVSPLPGAPSSA